jgi:hypothetical protein
MLLVLDALTLPPTASSIAATTLNSFALKLVFDPSTPPELVSSPS